MKANDVLSMYENIAGVTTQLASAAHSGDREGMLALERQCAMLATATASDVPALSGAPRLRKIDLLKQIMANDRAVTEPWELADVMHSAH